MRVIKWGEGEERGFMNYWWRRENLEWGLQWFLSLTGGHQLLHGNVAQICLFSVCSSSIINDGSYTAIWIIFQCLVSLHCQPLSSHYLASESMGIMHPLPFLFSKLVHFWIFKIILNIKIFLLYLWGQSSLHCWFYALENC